MEQQECSAGGGKELFKKDEGHCGDSRAREAKKDRKGRSREEEGSQMV